MGMGLVPVSAVAPQVTTAVVLKAQQDAAQRQRMLVAAAIAAFVLVMVWGR